MSLLARLLSIVAPQTVPLAARGVARSCYAPLRETVEGRITGMTRAEARGYARAYSTPLVRQAVEAAMRRDSRIPLRGRELLFRLAAEQLVADVVADVFAAHNTRELRRRAA